jgi:hypothetical protein
LLPPDLREAELLIPEEEDLLLPDAEDRLPLFLERLPEFEFDFFILLRI